MALHGTIIQLPNGQFGFEYTAPLYDKPEAIRQVWTLDAWKCEGMSWCQETDAIGKPATITDGRVSCYLGNGNYFKGWLKDGGSTKSIILEHLPIPCPKSRCETRYYNSQWQKYSKAKGWIAA